MHTRSTRPSALAALLLLPLVGCATTGSSTGARSTGPFADTPAGNFTRQDRLRGSVTPEREWWDLLHYRLDVEVMPETKRLAGSNAITFKALKTGKRMQVDLQPHHQFEVEGDDLAVEVPVQVWDAALGTRLPVPTLDGVVQMTLPGGVSSGQRMRLKGKGLPRRDGSRGDLYATLRIVLPSKMSPEQKQLFMRLRSVSAGVSE